MLWSDLAKRMLKQIHAYHLEVANAKVARKIIDGVFLSTRQLPKYPESGQIEPSLTSLDLGHRYLVSGHYKVIYREIVEGILITDVFDTRQDPAKINRPERGKKSR